MDWASRKRLGLQRAASAWLIRKHIDPDARFHFVEEDRLLEVAALLGAKTFHGRGVGDFPMLPTRSTFAVLMDKHDLWGKDPALDLMGRLLDKWPPGVVPDPEVLGLRALTKGFVDSIPDDHEKLRVVIPMYEAFYRWCGKRLEGVQLI